MLEDDSQRMNDCLRQMVKCRLVGMWGAGVTTGKMQSKSGGIAVRGIGILWALKRVVRADP